MALPRITGVLRRVLLFVAAAVIGCLVAGIVILVVMMNGQPDLSVWHLANLDEEFSLESDIENFDQYLALEERLFRQLDEVVYENVPQGVGHIVNRYSRGSRSDPEIWPRNWNRSFILPSDDPRAGVLLLHGLSDSPYSLRNIGERLSDQGAMVVGLRVPGHGTAPSGLVETTWQDMAAAVRLAARHVRDNIGDRPVYIVGYSNGGALAMEYALAALDDESMLQATGIILISPEIGVSGAAALAVWQGRIGHLLGLEKLAWNVVLPEYDPFKYGSFAVNAGDLAHRITLHIQEQLTSLQGSSKLNNLPPILAFQSGVDATVTASALVANLFDRLPSAKHELVLFDINRRADISMLLKQDPGEVFGPLLARENRSFDLTLVTNEYQESNRVVAITDSGSGTDDPETIYIGDWPVGVYSLSHVALPFSPTDPVYGGPQAAPSPGIALGNLSPRGERGVLYISGTEVLRLRWNPFYHYVEQRLLEFTALE